MRDPSMVPMVYVALNVYEPQSAEQRNDTKAACIACRWHGPKADQLLPA